VNFLLAAGILGAFFVAGGSGQEFWDALLGRGGVQGSGDVPFGARASLAQLFEINVMLGVFNLVPAYPMDGGRILRSLLASFLDFGKATRIAARVGAIIAIVLAVIGIYWNQPLIVLVALFVFLSGRQEAAHTTTRELLEGVSVRAAMATRFVSLATYQSLEEATAALLGTAQHDFPVVGDDGRLLGMLSRNDLLRELPRRGMTGRVIDAARRGIRPVSPDAPLTDVFDRMNSIQTPAVPVVEDDKIVGLVSADGIQKLLMVRSALKGALPQRS
jgi:CBS domain-containing protein